MNNLSDDRKDAPTRVEYWEVEADAAGQRLDNYLMSRLKGVPRTRIYRLLRKGEVRVNKGRSTPSYRVQAGDRLRIPPIRRTVADPASPPPAAVRRRLADRILFEDERLLVVDKPSGMAVHGGSGLSFGVIEALRAVRPGDRYLELVHRLDRETSGCLLVARRRSYLRSLHSLLRQGRVEKRYLALVRGQWHLGTRTLKDRVRTQSRKGGERHVTVAEEGKEAISRFSPVEIFSNASLVEVQLMTGRTHQIRVQAAAAGHPLAGDDRYGDPAFNRQMKRAGLVRMFLHASSLSFEDPVNGELRSFSAPLPDELRGVLDALEPASRPRSGR
jgi:23S rRNA pseudouridine955/2504/2580 synthase